MKKLGFSIAVTLLAWISIASFWSTHTLVSSFDSVAQAHQALEKFQHIEVLMEAAESGVRSYVITSDAAQLDSHHYATLVVPYELKQIATLLTFQTEKQIKFNALSRLLANHLDYLSSLIALRRSQGFEAAARAMASESTVSKREAMEHLLSEIQQEEMTQMHHRWGGPLETRSPPKLFDDDDAGNLGTTRLGIWPLAQRNC